MKTFRNCLVAAIAVAGCLWITSTAEAGGRRYFGGHPYHNGFYNVPPASAWMAVTVRPPIFYGAPAYYFPSSYLGEGAAYTYMPHPPHYASIPPRRAAGYYMSARAYTHYYPW